MTKHSELADFCRAMSEEWYWKALEVIFREGGVDLTSLCLHMGEDPTEGKAGRSRARRCMNAMVRAGLVTKTNIGGEVWLYPVSTRLLEIVRKMEEVI